MILFYFILEANIVCLLITEKKVRKEQNTLSDFFSNLDEFIFISSQSSIDSK